MRFPTVPKRAGGIQLMLKAGWLDYQNRYICLDWSSCGTISIKLNVTSYGGVLLVGLLDGLLVSLDERVAPSQLANYQVPKNLSLWTKVLSYPTKAGGHIEIHGLPHGLHVLNLFPNTTAPPPKLRRDLSHVVSYV